jgi:hypothetical protein
MDIAVLAQVLSSLATFVVAAGIHKTSASAAMRL